MTVAPVGTASVALLELKVIGSASTSTYVIELPLLLMVVPVVVAPLWTFAQAVLAVQVNSVLPTRVMSPVVFELNTEAKDRTMAALAGAAASTESPPTDKARTSTFARTHREREWRFTARPSCERWTCLLAAPAGNEVYNAQR